MTAIDDVLRKVRDLNEKATKGPWCADFTEADGRVQMTAGPVKELPDGRFQADWLADFDRHDGGGDDRADNAANGEFCAESRTLLPRVAKALGILAAAMDKLSNGDDYHVGCAAEAALIEAEAALKGEDRG